ncbi:CBS-domain-containing membrane protein [Halostagnicola sp. A56]|uniref:HPP family protein n=1 Tax=Halostagnicola sp. A56 TaxID=1495067 RepID=UPI00049F9D1E|nr:HPP family protein [Halostagnicola sp. A56]KDE58579.1 CBS-domain-containing membrane protein [Halostagnicola sp. A56]
MDDQVGSTLHTGLLITTTAALAWVSGLSMLFPSLGPTAFVLALFEESDATSPRRVIGGHAIGVLAGLGAYHLLASGIAMTAAMDPGSVGGLRLAASGVLATTLTAGGMLATKTRHPPACATTLIVALGLLPTVLEGALILLAVVVLVLTHRLLLATERWGARRV